MSNVDIVKKQPLFILGAPRTGTTLLRLVLNAHSNIAIPEELHFFRSKIFGKDIERWQELTEANAGNVDFLERAISFMSADTQHDFLEECIQDIPLGKHIDLRATYTKLACAYADTQGKERWGEKTPENILYADILYEMFPDASFIVMERDPRAIISSMNNVFFYPDDTYQNIMNLMFYADKGYAKATNSIPKGQRFHVHYECFTADPEEYLQRICDFIGENYESEMLSFHKNSASAMSANMQHSYNANALSPISQHQTNSWEKRLTNIEKYAVSLAFDLPDVDVRASLLTGQEINKAQRNIETAEAFWIKRRMAHHCPRDFQLRNPGQPINSNQLKA